MLPGRSALSCILTDPPARVFACPGRLLYVSLWKTHYNRPVLTQIFIISFPACLLNDREKCFTCCWDSVMGQAEFKTVSCSSSAMSCTHHCTRWELKYKVPAAERNSWHGFGFQAFTVLFNSNYRNLKHVRGESWTSHLPSPLHPL